MAKKPEFADHSKIITTPLEEIMGDRFGRYSKYIIQDRALPDVRDGLKPVQRRILYAMQIEGNTHEHKYRKSAKAVGIIMGNFHPHGDESIYDAMVRLSQDWKSRIPLIDMQGNNGSIDDDPAAAMRYTEVRLAPIAQMMLQDYDKETIAWAPNFDDTEVEPTVLPARYPTLLVNGITGIASGYATNIPPHNLSEAIDAAIYRIQYPNCSLDELMEYIQGPDFPTGGIVQGLAGIRDAFASGKGKIMIRSKVEIVQSKTAQQLLITEIPYEVVKSNMVKKIDAIRLLKKIDGITDVRDESDRNGLRIVVDLKKDADANFILQYLYKNTDLQVSYNYNIIAIVNKRPMQIGLAAMLDAFIDHRHEVIYKRSVFELKKKEQRCHILEGLIKAISVLDEIIALIRSAKDKTDSKNKIIDRFHFSDAQAEAIVTMRLYRLSNTDVTLLKEEYARLLNEIEELHDIIENPKILKKVMIDELKEVKKLFGVPRLTKIEQEIEEIVIDKMAMIANEQVMVSITRDGYLKKVSMRSFGASEGLPGMKESDQLIGYREMNTFDQILFFTNKGTYGYTPVYEIEDTKWKEVGSHISSIMKLSSQEKIISAYALKDFTSHAYVITVSRKGMIKKSLLKEFAVSRSNKTFTAMSLSGDDEVVAAFVAYEKEEVMILSQNGYMVRYPLSLIPLTALKAKGVKAMNLSEDRIVDANAVTEQDVFVIVINDQYQSKRIKLSDITVTGRPAKGNLICKKVKSKPFVMSEAIAVPSHAQIHFVKEQMETYEVTDFTLMNKDATFSGSVKAQDYRYRGIAKIHFATAPQETPSQDVHVENLNFDL